MNYFPLRALVLSTALLVAQPFTLLRAASKFDVVETTLDDIHAAMKAGKLTSHELIQLYLNRIDAYDKKGPQINCIITLNPAAMDEADKLDATFKKSGFVGPLHGIPV
jgi:Asp-tRNA(Asn)/Glu-tRNA(Gln) amidotransferase A subunit family amidase